MQKVCCGWKISSKLFILIGLFRNWFLILILLHSSAKPMFISLNAWPVTRECTCIQLRESTHLRHNIIQNNISPTTIVCLTVPLPISNLLIIPSSADVNSSDITACTETTHPDAREPTWNGVSYSLFNVSRINKYHVKTLRRIWLYIWACHRTWQLYGRSVYELLSIKLLSKKAY